MRKSVIAILLLASVCGIVAPARAGAESPAGPNEQANNAIAAQYTTPGTEFYPQRALTALSEAFSATSVQSLVAAVSKLPPGAKEIAQQAISSVDLNAADAVTKLQNALSTASQSIVDSAQQSANSVTAAVQETSSTVRKVLSTMTDMFTDEQKLLMQGVTTIVNRQTAPSGMSDMFTDEQKQLMAGITTHANYPTTPSYFGAGEGSSDPLNFTYKPQPFDINWQDSLTPVVPEYYSPPLNYPTITGGKTGGDTNIHIYEPEFTDKNSMDYMANLIRQSV